MKRLTAVVLGAWALVFAFVGVAFAEGETMATFAAAARTQVLSDAFSWLTDLNPLVLILVGLGAFRMVVSILRRATG